MAVRAQVGYIPVQSTRLIFMLVSNLNLLLSYTLDVPTVEKIYSLMGIRRRNEN